MEYDLYPLELVTSQVSQTSFGELVILVN